MAAVSLALLGAAFAESPRAQANTRSFFDAPTSADTSCLAGPQPPRFEIAP
ncbi:hypothetical protein [Streptomyces antibioticus]|uniref:hypothetical protein n=1 Tax=Streptomyces antibioticus TaxID=1890 RepID=UPI0033DF1484